MGRRSTTRIVAGIGAMMAMMAITACGGERTGRAPSAGGDPPQSATHPSNPEQMFQQWGCALCHGPDGRGTDTAPALSNLREHWTPETLAAYVLAPQDWRTSDPRLGDLAARYPVEMPPTNRPETERRALATWLLAR
jgi:cytochrome c553